MEKLLFLFSYIYSIYRKPMKIIKQYIIITIKMFNNNNSTQITNITKNKNHNKIIDTCFGMSWKLNWLKFNSFVNYYSFHFIFRFIV